MDVICIGSAVIDIMAQPVGNSAEWKEKQRIQTIQIQTGGDAANQSSRLADLGLDAAVCTCIGPDQNGAGRCEWRTAYVFCEGGTQPDRPGYCRNLL